MKKFALFLILAASIWPGHWACAEAKPPVSKASGEIKAPDKGSASKKDPHETLLNKALVVETDEDTAKDSLNRVSGTVDLGFSAPENSYKTEERPGGGPFEKAKAEERKRANAGY